MNRILSVLALVLIAACSSNDSNNSAGKPTTPTPTTGPGTSTMSCTAALPNNGAAVNSGAVVPVTLRATGGSAPYSYNATSFESTLTVPKVYTNTGTTSLVVMQSFVVNDSRGSSTSCSTPVTILPINGGGSNLSCQISLAQTLIRVNQSASFMATISGGTTPYTVQSFNWSGGTVDSINYMSNSQITASVSYPITGLKSVTMTVQDANLNQYSCGINFTVLSLPTLSLTASPSTSVETGKYINLSPTALGFTSAATITYQSSDPAVIITSSGGGATVHATDQLVHNFTITATATAGNDVAQATIALQFSPFIPLVCNLSRTGILKTGENIHYTLTATNGEALRLTEFNPGFDGSVLSNTSNTATIKYYSPGAKTVVVKAASITSGKQCNSGAGNTEIITIANALSCSVAFGSSSVSRYTYSTVSATVPASAPFSPFYLTNVTISPSYGGYYYGNYSNTGAYVVYNYSGYFNVQLTVQDVYGNTASCSGYQYVY